MRSENLSSVDVPLTQGRFAKVSQQDAELVAGHRWQAVMCSGKWYARKQDGHGGVTYMHRLILGLGVGNSLVVDHINGNPLDNTRGNIRIVTQGVNLQNRLPKRGGTGYLGVFRHCNGWIARIQHNKKKTYLGFFSDPVLAAKAYDRAAQDLIGRGARLNFLEAA